MIRVIKKQKRNKNKKQKQKQKKESRENMVRVLSTFLFLHCIFSNSFLHFVTHFFAPLSAYQYASNLNDSVRVVRHTGIPADATVGTSSENEWEMKNIEILFVGLYRGTPL